MSTERYGGYKFRYVHDRKSPGKVKVYVEEGGGSRTEHMYEGKNGSPPFICFKERSKPSSHSQARSLARQWANMNRR
jgi:hypothetical protein